MKERGTYTKETMHANDDTAKDKSQDDESEKVVAVKLQENRIHGSTSSQESSSFCQESIDLLSRLLPQLDRDFDNVADEADGCKWTVEEQSEERAFMLLVMEW